MNEEIEELKDIESEQANITDDSNNDETQPSVSYSISSYGADFDVEGIVNRMKRGDIIIPPFQRDYVWNLSDASRFIESLLLGLPVPGIFLAKEIDSGKSLVIDGQQRLKTLLFFYGGFFNPKNDQKTQRVFKLYNVQERFNNRTIDGLDPKDRLRLNDTIIHATIIKQDSPDDDDTSVYHVFERLNTGGRKLVPQEIRSAIYHGGLIKILGELNQNNKWRSIFGRESKRLKDQELILRFFALYFSSSSYIKPMNEFLNIFCQKNRNPGEDLTANCINIFNTTISVIEKSLGTAAFRPERSLNAAVFDAVMVGLAKRIEKGGVVNNELFKTKYEELLSDGNFISTYTQSTSDTTSVTSRIRLASNKFETL